MTFTCYEREGHSSVMGIDLKTGQVVNFSKAPGTYNEVEGIFPDGQYTCVESDRQVAELGGRRGSPHTQILKVKAGGTGKNLLHPTPLDPFHGRNRHQPRQM